MSWEIENRSMQSFEDIQDFGEGMKPLYREKSDIFDLLESPKNFQFNNFQQKSNNDDFVMSKNPFDDDFEINPEQLFEDEEFCKDINPIYSTFNQQPKEVFEIEFEPFEDVQPFVKQNRTEEEKEKEIQKVPKINKVIKKTNYYDKNICRYLIRMCIRSLISREYRQKVLDLCGGDREIYQKIVDNFLRKIEYKQEDFLGGYKALKNYLMIYEEDNQETIKEKKVFQKFTHWFLKKRALRQIVSGNMKDKKSYINYKNNVMLKYIMNPSQWKDQGDQKRIQQYKG